jgi:hypothetical protein
MMPLSRVWLIAACALAVAASAAWAQPAGGSDAAIAQEALSFREKIRSFVAAKDQRALQAAYADNFMHLRDSGRVDLKAERIAILLSGESTIEVAPEENIAVQFYTPATVAVTGVSRIKDRATGASPRFRWLTVYVKQADGWKVALSQASRAPPGSR